MRNLVLLTAALAFSSFAFSVQAKPVTQQMHACNSSNNDIRTISTHCKNQAAGFTLRYSITQYGDYGSLLKVFNPTSRNIKIYRIELLDGFNEQCQLDSWGPDGETIYAKSYFKVITGDCKPERILQYVFIQGNKRYVF